MRLPLISVFLWWLLPLFSCHELPGVITPLTMANPVGLVSSQLSRQRLLQDHVLDELSQMSVSMEPQALLTEMFRNATNASACEVSLAQLVDDLYHKKKYAFKGADFMPTLLSALTKSYLI